MLGYGDYGDSVYAGIGWGVTIAPDQRVKADPTRNYVGSGPGFLYPKSLHAASPAIDDLTRQFGPRLYAAMLTDPAVSSSYNSLKLSILSGGMKLRTPDAYKAPAWSKLSPAGEKRPGPTAPPKSDTPDAPAADRQLSPDQKRAAEILEFCERLPDRLAGGLQPLLLQWLDAMAEGVKLAEVTYKVAADGEDAGKLVWDTVRVRPNWAWRFVVDNTMTVKGVFTWDVETSQYVILDVGDPALDKFVWHTWMPKDGDPRGTSQLRAAYNAWNLKIQTWPMYYAHLVRFGSPGIHGTLPESAAGDVLNKPPIDPTTGLAIPGAANIGEAEYMKRCLAMYQSGGIIVTANGAAVAPFEPKSDGQAFALAMDLFAREIKLAIEYQTRTSMESKHGSKADSGTAQDEKGVVTRFGRDSLSGPVRQLYRLAVAANFGVGDAERFTPVVEFGDAEHQDQSALWTAGASLYTAGVIGDSQKEEFAVMLGLPVPDLAADQAAADAKMAQAAALLPDPAKPGDTGKGGLEKAPAKGPVPGKGGAK